MIFLGLLLILIAAGAGVLLVIGAQSLNQPIQLHVLDRIVELPPLGLLIAGAATVALLWLGWVLFFGGIKRGSRRRKAAKQSAREAEAARVEHERRAQEEFAQRERQLAEERRRREVETEQARREGDDRVAEQHLATEDARGRAETAERELKRRDGQ